MKKAISKSLIFVSMALIFALSMFFGLSANITSAVHADAPLLISTEDTSLLIVNAQSHDDAILNATTSSNNTKFVTGASEEEGRKSETYRWRDVRNFNIALNTNSPDLSESTEYNYKYTVTWTPALISNNQATFDTDHSVTVTILEAKADTKSEIVSNLRFAVDNNLSSSSTTIVGQNKLGDVYTKNGGWGLYIFSFEYSTIGQKQSQIIELLPDSVEGLSKPIISVKKISSDQTVEDAFLFSVDASYKYVKRDLIYWSISGTGKDGRSYVLTPQDIINPNTTNSVFPDESVERTGLTFLFDPAIEGTWEAQCGVFKDIDRTERYETAYSEKVSTVRGLSTQSIIWIVVGAAAAAGIVVAVVIFVSIRKEKVY